MPTDLYPLYKLIAQRSRRDPEDVRKAEMTEIAYDMMKRRPPGDELLAMAERMSEIEHEIPGLSTYFSTRMKDAIVSGDYVIKVPYVKQHAWNELPTSSGHVYIAVAGSRPTQSKLGATYNDPEERLQKYFYRYGYSVRSYWSTYVRCPFSFESAMRRKLLSLSSAQLTFGNSNEWYNISAGELQTVIERELLSW